MSSDNESIHGHEDDLEGDFEDLTNAADAKDLFGSDSDSEIDSDRAGDSKSVAQPSQISEQDVDERELFGDDDDDDIEKVHVDSLRDVSSEADEEEEEEIVVVPAQLAYTRPPRSDEGKLYVAALPNFLNVDPKPFDPDTYEEEEEREDDEEDRIKLKVDNTVRWRYVTQPNGETTKESNARFIRWSDGSLSMILGDEIFDVKLSDNSKQQQYLAATQSKDGFLVTQGQLKDRMIFRPFTMANTTHKKLVTAIAGKYKKTYKTKMITTNEDPEKLKLMAEKAEAERIKTQRRLENSRRAVANRMGFNEETLEAVSDDEMMGYSTSFRRQDEDDLADFIVDDEDDENDEELEEKERAREERILNAKKRRGESEVNSGRKRRRDSFDDDLDLPMDDDEDDEDLPARKSGGRKKQAVFSSDEDDE